MGLRIFLSYGHDDIGRVLAPRLKASLEARGHDVWIDASSIKTGKDWEIEIEKGIEGSNAVVAIMTLYAVRREPPPGVCLDEISYSRFHKKQVIPLMAEPCKPPLSVARLQYLDMTDWNASDAVYQAKLDEICKVLDGREASFGGETASLENELKPLDFGAEIDEKIRGFYGREWIMKEVDAWLANPGASPVFFLVGDPGVGKTAIAAKLCRHPSAVAYHLCNAADKAKSDAKRAVMSIAFQLATQVPAYRSHVAALSLPSILDNTPEGIFDALVIQVLHKIPTPANPMLVIIDALDEAQDGDENDLAGLLATLTRRMPPWVRLFITSRRERPVLNILSGLVHRVLDTREPRNVADIRGYFTKAMEDLHAEGKIQQATVPREAVDTVVTRSEGVFLYASFVVEAIKDKQLFLDHPEDFPDGLRSVYRKFFKRQFHSPGEFDTVRPLLEVLCAIREPVPLKTLDTALGWDSTTRNEILAKTGALFPVDNGLVRPFHKSVIDWLTDEKKAEPWYFIDPARGNKRLVTAGLGAAMQDINSLDIYYSRNLIGHLIREKKWEEVTAILTDKTYVERTIAMGLGEEIIGDYALALQKLPKNLEGREALEKTQRLVRWRLRNPDINIPEEEVDVLVELEVLMDRAIPWVDEVGWITFGFAASAGHVTGLGLYSKGLTSLPDSIGNLKALTYLSLMGNKLSSLPDSIGQLKTLTRLDLESNKLSSLPDSIGQLKSLTKLELQYNNLTSLPDTIGNLVNLKELYLYENQLSSLPGSIGNLVNLKELLLYNNQQSSLPGTIEAWIKDLKKRGCVVSR